MGELFAWIIGWDLILEYAMASSSVAVGWSGYFGKLMALFNIHFPLWLMNDHITAHRLIEEATQKDSLDLLSKMYSSIEIPNILGLNIAINLPAFLIIMVITIILVKGIKEAASTNLFLVILKVSVVLFVIIAGASFIDTKNWHPFVPERIIDKDGVGHYGWMGVLSGLLTYFSHILVSIAYQLKQGEAKNPQKDVPFGIIVSLKFALSFIY
jgi:APA family basic amino acid/polyamine antiporter